MQTTPDSFLYLLIFGAILATLFMLLSIAEKGVAIWRRTRREPSLEDTLSQFARLEDMKPLSTALANLEKALGRIVTTAEMNQVIAEVRSEISNQDARLSEEIRTVRSYNSKTSKEIFDLIRSQNTEFSDRIGKLQSSIETEFRALNKEIGKLQGQTSSR